MQGGSPTFELGGMEGGGSALCGFFEDWVYLPRHTRRLPPYPTLDTDTQIFLPFVQNSDKTRLAKMGGWSTVGLRYPVYPTISSKN